MWEIEEVPEGNESIIIVVGGREIITIFSLCLFKQPSQKKQQAFVGGML